MDWFVRTILLAVITFVLIGILLALVADTGVVEKAALGALGAVLFIAASHIRPHRTHRTH